VALQQTGICRRPFPSGLQDAPEYAVDRDAHDDDRAPAEALPLGGIRKQAGGGVNAAIKRGVLHDDRRQRRALSSVAARAQRTSNDRAPSWSKGTPL
jgi:hypothetical protein